MVPSLDSVASALSVHDAVLTVIPASIAVSLMLAVVLPFSAVTAMAVGSVPATGSIGYALFYNPPDSVTGD